MLIVAQVLGYVIEIVAIISWIVCLFTGDMPLGLRDLTAWIVRFTAQTHGYVSCSPTATPTSRPTRAVGRDGAGAGARLDVNHG